MRRMGIFLVPLLLLGSFAPVAYSQGRLPPPTVLAFSAQPPMINLGETARLSWIVQNAYAVTIDQGIGAVKNSGGFITVAPAQNTVYTLTAYGAGGTARRSVTVTVNTKPTIPMSWKITNTTPDTMTVWYGVTEGTVNSQSAQPTLSGGASASGSFQLPAASLYEGSAHVTVLKDSTHPVDCWQDVNADPNTVSGLASQVVVSQDTAGVYSCSVAVDVLTR